MDSVLKYGRTEEEAVKEALKEMGAAAGEVEATVVEAGSKGFLGIGGKPWKVEVRRIFDPVRVSKKFMDEVAAAMRISIEINAALTDRNLDISVGGRDAGRLIGKHGQTLDAFQYLLSLVVNKGKAPFVNVTLDCENYRQKRKETLETFARNMAKKAKQQRRNIVLEPMSSYERKIIHAALQSDKLVSTYSEGDEPYRNVVISPKRY